MNLNRAHPFEDQTLSRRAVMNLNRAHPFEDQTLVIVCVMAQDQTVRNLKTVTLARDFLSDEIRRLTSKLNLARLWIRVQQVIHIRRHATDSDILHVTLDHLA